MYQPLTTYVAFAHHAAFAHRTKDTDAATELFANLWHSLDQESLADHCTARAAFNEAFAKAYRSRWEPGSPVIEPKPAPAPQPAPAPRYVAPAPRTRTPSVASVALDCAAFFARKSEA